MRQAVILAGGMGTRLGALTTDRPKPLLDVGGRPFLDYLGEHLVRHGVEHVVLLVGPHTARFRGIVARPEWQKIEVDVVADLPAAGTGGALRYARDLLDAEFLLLNGDSFFDFNLLDLSCDSASPPPLTMALRKVADTARYGSVTLDGDRIVAFGEKSVGGEGLINAGVYRLSRDFVDTIPNRTCSMESDLIPELVRRGRAGGRVYDGPFIDIGVPDSFAAAQDLLPGWRRRPAAFLDRDGILNHDTGYVWRTEEYRWQAGAAGAVKRLNDLGYYVFVVTNQAGVARGLYGCEDIENLHRWINRTLRRRGAHVDAFYYCPHHPEVGRGPFTRACECRKPGPGMLLQAMKEWPVDLSRSFMIGDKETDMAAAEAAGVPTRRLFHEGGDIEAAIREIAPPWRAT